ncbi:MAG: helix-turn-helix domain-containing protein [Nitriliruptorales bacterium]|nr:helix-turn-helix domain-containing protein [Nitriliruptorales bacterium]
MASDAKPRILQQQGSFNLRSQAVGDPLFLKEPFFDPRDLVQVKYEMLRRVQSEGHSVTQAASAFGFSRPSFYQALSAFEQGGLGGLIPQKRGPKAAHKLTAEVLRFVRERQAADSELRAPALAPLIARHFGVVVHPRSIERALAHSQKKRQAP